MSALLIVLGIALLYFGGELLVDNAIRLANRLRISPIVIGLTVVSFATSAPELAATVTAALRGSSAMALGNAFGSNIANLGLILGLSALVYPLRTTLQFIRREVAFMVLVTLLLYPFLVGGQLERWQGLMMLGLLAIFLVTLLRDPETDQEPEVLTEPLRPVWALGLGLGIGVALLVLGAQALVGGGTQVARSLGVTERVIGLTLVALGTSLPELAASIVAARRRQADLVLGNVVGSNIFNLLCILGVTSLVNPIRVPPEALALDYWVMLAISAVLPVILVVRMKLGRFDGALLLTTYVVYIAWLFR